MPKRIRSVATALLWDDLFRTSGRSAPAEKVLRAASSCDHIPVVAATGSRVLLLLDPAAARGRHTPGHMKLQYLDLVTALLLSESCMQASARLRLPAWSSVKSRLLRQRPDCVSTPTPLPASDPALHLSAPVRGVAVANASLGLA